MHFYRTSCSKKYAFKIVHTIIRMLIHSHYMYCILYYLYMWGGGHGVAQFIEALCYKPEGRRFDSRWCTGIFHCHNPSDAQWPWG